MSASTASSVIGFAASVLMQVALLSCYRTKPQVRLPDPQTDTWKCQDKHASCVTPNLGTIEVCLSDIESAVSAVSAGANSIELCSDRAGGGVTPSFGLICQCVQRLKSHPIQIHVLVRPRVGDFIYSEAELEVICSDIRAARDAGADGVVVGVLTGDGHIDVPKLKRIRQESEGMLLTFHRAIDVCSSYLDALDAIIACGCDRILTSGQQSSALRGLPNLSKIVLEAAGSIAVIAAAGINADNADIIIAGTGVHGVHAGSSVMSTVSHDTIPMPAHDDRSNKTATMGTNVNFADDMKWDAVDEAKVARYVNCANEGFSTFKRNQRLLPAPTLPADCTTDYIDLCPMYS